MQKKHILIFLFALGFAVYAPANTSNLSYSLPSVEIERQGFTVGYQMSTTSELEFSTVYNGEKRTDTLELDSFKGITIGYDGRHLLSKIIPGLGFQVRMELLGSEYNINTPEGLYTGNAVMTNTVLNINYQATERIYPYIGLGRSSFKIIKDVYAYDSGISYNMGTAIFVTSSSYIDLNYTLSRTELDTSGNRANFTGDLEFGLLRLGLNYTF